MALLRSVRFWIGMLVSLFFLWLAFHNLPFQALALPAASANYFWILPAVVAQLFSVVARSLRWTVLLKQPRRFAASFWAQGLFESVIISSLFQHQRAELLEAWRNDWRRFGSKRPNRLSPPQKPRTDFGEYR